MLTSLLLATAIWPTPVTQYCSPPEETILVGVAKDYSGAHVYCELISQPDKKSLAISYTKDGKTFAEKKLTYAEDVSKPSVIQKDFRTGELRQADINDKNITLQYQSNPQKKLGIATIANAKIDVVDAGFDNFIRANWDDLAAGKTRSISFASIAHLKALSLRVSLQPLQKCASAHQLPPSMTCFYVEIDNTLLRMILGNIKVVYDQDHRLYQFNGVVNIEDDKQDNQKAIINYFYAEDYVNPPK